MAAQRWPRCGSGVAGSAQSDITALRHGLAMAENPSGVLRGTLQRRPAPRPTVTAWSTSSTAAAPSQPLVAMSGVPLQLLPATQPARSRAPPNRVPPTMLTKEQHEMRLPGRRAHAVIKFRGGGDNDEHGPSADWCCAICLRTTWDRHDLSRMPRCGHTFHTRCCNKWFERSSDCPFCRQPV